MDKVLTSDQLQKNNVTKYHFRSFDSDVGAQVIETGTVFSPQSEPEVPVLAQNPAIAHASHSMIETLLTKVDDLSSSLVKMEMQMENQQNDFASRLVAETQRAFEDGEKQGYDKGVSQGQRLLEDYEHQLGDSVQKIVTLCDKLERRYQEIEEQIVQSALLLAKQVMAREVSQQSATIATSIAKEVLALAVAGEKVTLKVHPDDEKMLKEALTEQDHVTIYGDNAVARGGVVMLSDSKNLDASLLQRFEQMTKTLL